MLCIDPEHYLPMMVTPPLKKLNILKIIIFIFFLILDQYSFVSIPYFEEQKIGVARKATFSFILKLTRFNL